MSGKEGSPDKRRTAKGTEDKSGSSTPTQQSPQKHFSKHGRRRRRNRVSSASSDGVVHEARRDLRHMERLLLHSGKLHVFRAYFGDPDLDFYVRPEGRRRHAAGARNRRPPDEGRALAVLGVQEIDDNQGGAAAAAGHLDNNPPERPQAIQEEEGPSSVLSDRGLSSVSSFTTFPPSPPECNSDFEMVPFAGLPPIRERSEAAAASSRPPRPEPKSTSSSSADHDDYMASGSASDSDESARSNRGAIQMANRLNQMAVSGSSPAPLPSPEPMSLSSDPATPRESE